VSRQRIAFIGGGNMASSMAGGLLARGWDPADIRVSDPLPDSQTRFRDRGIAATADNAAAAAEADVVIFAVKPQQMRSVCRELAPSLASRRPLVLSIAAGVPVAAIQSWLGRGVPIVRCMPNTPALVQSGATVLYASERVGPAERETAGRILEAVGTVAWVDEEELLHAVTALSGSGPAYFFLVMEAMQIAGEQLGLDAALSRRLTTQTALGAARMALDETVDIAELRRRVTSPGGTTERALRIFEERGLRRLFDDALEAAARRSRELAGELGPS